MNRYGYCKRWLSIIAWLLLLALLTGCSGELKPSEGGSTMPSATQGSDKSGIRILSYPDAAVQKLSDPNFTLSEFTKRGAGETSYKGNGHYDGTSLVESPYFTASVNSLDVPVYATPVYVATESHGALHSYASLDVDFSVHSMVTITLSVNLVKMQYAEVYSHDPAVLSYADQTIRLTVTKNGAYTVVLNDSQNYAITIFVRTYEDEDAKIREYQDLYGAENVIVYEPGLHEIDYILMLKSNTVLYLKAGAVLLPRHTMDIQSDQDAAAANEFGAAQTNAIGLKCYPVINGFNAQNLIIAGRGTVDMTQLDWHERRGIVFTLCKNVTMDGVIILNPSEWAFITYRCENVTVTQSAVMGYRTNSDAFAICNSIEVDVSNCFARTGDDMFEVKTLGGVETAISRDITFSRCQAWGSKARCFGVIGEIEKDVSNILFEDGIVIFRDATWDNNRIGSLVVLRECGTGTVKNVTFRNITIHHDAGRAIQVGVYTDDLSKVRMEGIVFENITYTAQKDSQIRANVGEGNVISVIFKNVKANGMLLTTDNVYQYTMWDQSGMVTVE